MKRFMPVLFVSICIWTLHIFITTEIANTGYRISPIKKEVEKARNENRELAAKVAQKESLGKIEKKASGDLSMKYPEKIKYLVVSGEAD